MTRRPGKPRPVQGQAGPSTRPGEVQVGRRALGGPGARPREIDGRSRQDPAYRPAKERPREGAFPIVQANSGSQVANVNFCLSVC